MKFYFSYFNLSLFFYRLDLYFSFSRISNFCLIWISVRSRFSILFLFISNFFRLDFFLENLFIFDLIHLYIDFYEISCYFYNNYIKLLSPIKFKFLLLNSKFKVRDFDFCHLKSNCYYIS